MQADVGYVRYNGDKQLCERLSSRGNTLHCSRKTPLINLVRHEYRALCLAEKRYQ